MKTATEVLRSLVADIEAMKAKQQEHWFGGFESWYEDHDATGVVYVQWPNLGILLEEAEQALKEQKDGLLVAAKDFRDDFVEYVNSDDRDLPDISELERAIQNAEEVEGSD